MKRRLITEKQLKEILIYHELSHYVLCEISRRIEPNFTKATKIKLSHINEKAQIQMACYPNTIIKGLTITEIKKLEKDFYLETNERVFLKTLQLACGYLTSTIFVLDDHLDYFINPPKIFSKEQNGDFFIYFYNLYEGIQKNTMNSDFQLIDEYWNKYSKISLNENIWETIIKYTKTALKFNLINDRFAERPKFYH
jgi:hypothetical protein